MQSIKKNFFEFFGLPTSFDVDLDSLSEKYHELQKEFHPDATSLETEVEKMRSVQFTSFVNEAYNTLKSPIKRAGYFLTTQGFDIENVSQSELDMDLLLEQMQLREKLAELPKDDTAMPVLEKLKQDVKQKLLIQQSSFADDARSEKYISAKKTFHELQFLYKLLSEIEENEERRLEY